MSLVNFAQSELDKILAKCEDEESQRLQILITKDIMEIVKVFSDQGHSGSTASYVMSAIHKLLDWKPLSPLTGEDDEWHCPFDGASTEQNKRCSAVFRENHDNSTAHYIDGKVFSDDGGQTWFTNRDSSVPVIFPYVVPDEAERIILNGETETEA